MVIFYFYKNGKSTMKFNLQKNKIDLNNRIMKTHPPSSECVTITDSKFFNRVLV